ncbi:esterase 1 [Lactarius akahatsu]|uniref:Esterase 1 n=1 Tax=Lactarius akahatsu TaxID=416441 RepID=A0AAD4QEN4_9AGAM|nr:esterase 1 [Lactarius akahatsu]
MWYPWVWAYFTTLLCSHYPRVRLGGTSIIGKHLRSYNQDFFGGIPFAEPPTASFRFAPPQLKLSLVPSRSFDARSYGPSCLQLENMSEDCLTLNIFRPSGIDSLASLPVMVWIYGDGQSSIYDGSYFVEQSVARGTPILFVSLNYRVGPLGFPQGPEAAERAVLNLGLHDQWAALEWVQSNIASFGGDPAKVCSPTITSAQSLITRNQRLLSLGRVQGRCPLHTTTSTENFTAVARAAIFQSGVGSTLPIFNAYRGTPSWMLFANNTKSCMALTLSPDSTFSCLMSASPSDLLVGTRAGMAIELFPFRPVLDGNEGVISDQPVKRLARGAGQRVPFIAGTVLDEATMFLQRDFQTEDITTWLNANFTPSPVGPDALRTGLDKLLSLYPDDPSAGSPFGTGNQTFGTGPGFKRGSAIIGDIYFQALRRFWSQTTSALGTPSYAYIFTDPQPSDDPALGVSHDSELPYLFSDVSKNGPPNSARLSRAMLDYWISFAVSLTPNDGKGTQRML